MKQFSQTSQNVIAGLDEPVLGLAFGQTLGAIHAVTSRVAAMPME